jgi:hypothetical protein
MYQDKVNLEYWEDKNKFLVHIPKDLQDGIKPIFEMYYFLGSYIANDIWELDGKKALELIEWGNHLLFPVNVTEKAQQAINENNWYPIENKLIRPSRTIDWKLIFKDDVILKKVQKEGLEFLIGRTRSYLADDTGLGKTIQAIGTFCYWYLNNYTDGVIILVRDILTYQWEEEILKFSKLFKKEDIQIIDNSLKQKPFEKFKDKKILILCRDSFTDMFLSYKKKIPEKRADIKWGTVRANILKLWNKKSIALIIDEAHDYKNSNAARSKVLNANKHNFDFRLLMSATPGLNSLEDLYYPTHIMDPGIIPMTETAFKLNIAEEVDHKYKNCNIVRYSSAKVKNQLDKIKPYFIQRKKEDDPEMVAKRYIKPIHLRMTKEHKELMDDIYNFELTVRKDDKIKTVEQKFPYTLQAIDNPYLLTDKIINKDIDRKIKAWKFEKDNRIKYLDEFIKDTIDTQGKKIIIFDQHPLTLDTLAERYEKYKPLVVHGKSKDDSFSKNEKKKKFIDQNSGHQIFFLSAISATSGLNLQEGAHIVVFFSPPWDLGHRQGIDRTHRIVSINDTIIIILMFIDSYDNIRVNRNLSRAELNDNLFRNNGLEIDKLENLLQEVI